MKTLKIMTGLIVILLLIKSIAFPQTLIPPFRIGGTVTADGVLLSQSTDDGYTFEVTRQDGSSYMPPAEDTDGLNEYNVYYIDIPISDILNQPDGAMPGETAKIHAFYNNEELVITSPPNGEFKVGNSGDLPLSLNIIAHTKPQLIYPSYGQECLRTTEQFIWRKSTDPNRDQFKYKLQVCEDTEFTTGCISKENLSYINSKYFYYAGIGPWIFLFGTGLFGSYCKKRKLALLIIMLVITAMFLVSCGSTSEDNGTCEHPSVPNVDTQNEIVHEISGLKSGTTYYWKVIVTDEHNSSVHSETRSFTTQ